MRNAPEYLPINGNWRFLGIDVDSPSSQADPRSAADALNIDFLRGYIQTRRGYTTVGTQLKYDGALTIDPVLALYSFTDGSDDPQTVALTPRRQFAFQSGDWADLTPGTPIVEWTGTEDDGIQYVVGTSVAGRWFIATNGKDTPRYWDGVMSKFADLATDIPSFVTAKTLAVYGDSLVLGNITSSGSDPNVVEWSTAGNFTNFTTGTSGAALLPDARGAIQRLEVLNDRLAIYAEDSIGVMLYIGGTAIFSFATLITDTRLLSGRSVCNAGVVHFYAGRENIYVFDGTQLSRPIGDKIRSLYRQTLDLAHSSRAFAFHDSNENRAWFVIPADATTSVAFIYEYDRADIYGGTWTVHKYAEKVTSLGYYTRVDTETWNDAVGTWDDAVGTWYDLSTRAGFPSIALGVPGVIRWLQDDLASDATVPVVGTWYSRDFVVPTEWPGGLGRFSQIEFEAQGTSVSVSYSTNRGLAWSAGQTFILGSSPSSYRMYSDTIGQTLRIRMTATGPDTFKIMAVRVGVRWAGA